MKTSSGVELRSDSIGTAAMQLQTKGVIKFSSVRTDLVTDQKQIHIRPGSNFQKVIGYFSSKKSREAYANQVEGKLKNVLGDKATRQLLANIRAQIMQDGSVQGEFLARNLQAVDRGMHLMPSGSVRGKAVAKGQQVRIMEGAPTQIKSRFCLASFDTIVKELKANRETKDMVPKDIDAFNSLNDWEKKGAKDQSKELSNFYVDLTFSVPNNLFSFHGMNGPGQLNRTAGNMYDLIRNGIGDKTGAIVVEPQPNKIEFKLQPDGTKTKKIVYDDDCLIAQIKAAIDAKADAVKKNDDRVITFVSQDTELLQRIKQLYSQAEQESGQTKSPGPDK